VFPAPVWGEDTFMFCSREPLATPPVLGWAIPDIDPEGDGPAPEDDEGEGSSNKEESDKNMGFEAIVV
jgi:hypothetical protein